MGFSLNHILFFHMPRTAGDSIQKSILNISEKCRVSTHHDQKSTSPHSATCERSSPK